MNILVDVIDIEVADTFRVCDKNFVDLRTELPIQNISGAANLVHFFFTSQQDAIDRTNPLSPPVASFTDEGIIWIRTEKQGATTSCFDIEPFEFILDSAPDVAAIPNQALCGNTCLQTTDLSLTDPMGQAIVGFELSFYSSQTEAQAGDPNNSLGTEVCITGDYWLRVASSPTCFQTLPLRADFHPTPNIDDLMIDLDCQFGCVNLADLSLTEINGLDPTILQYDYFASQADAEDPAASPLSNLNICQPDVVWIRVVNTDNNCFDVAQLTISGIPLAEAKLSGDQTICGGDMATLAINITGNAPFVISYTDGVNFFDTTATTNSLTISVLPDSTRTYSLLSVKDNMACVGNTNGTALVMVNNRPILDNLSYNCNANSTEYELSFDIIGNSTYTVQNIAGTQTGNSFLSDFIPTGTNFTFQIISSDGCIPLEQDIVFSCECNSVVDLMDLQPIHVCDREAAIASYLGPGGENLEKEDFRYYVLHTNSDTTIGTVINYSNIPIFTFDDATMQNGTTYYISAVITKESTPGVPILDINTNPCMDVSEGTPVIFYSIPEVSLSLSSPNICQGEPVSLTFNIQGVGPYNLVFYDGSGLGTLMDISDGHTITVSPSFSTSFYVESISQAGVPNCNDTPLRNTNEISLTVFDTPVISNIQQHCNEIGDRLIITFDVTGGDPSSYSVNDLTGSFKGNEFFTDSIDANIPYQISVSDVNNCPAAPITGTTECLCTADISVNINTNQAISCRGEKDAILSAQSVNGAAPYNYFWSSGATTQQARNIPPGQSFVTMTDANGCEVHDTVSLIEPTSVIANFNTLPLSCYGSRDGMILIFDEQGGTGAYTYSFDNGQFQSDGLKNGFSAGVYPIAVRDANGCEWTGEATLQNPPELDVFLGGNAIINLGESYSINLQVNQEINGILWESADTSLCMNCLDPIVYPTKSGTYKVTVGNMEGCIASDQILIQVKNDRRIFIPNIFSPNGDGSNDLLHPFSSSEVQDIAMFRVFNRWGELIYEKKDVDTFSNLEGWDGITKEGRDAPPGVYLYYVEVAFKDGSSEVLTGDVSLVR